MRSFFKEKQRVPREGNSVMWGAFDEHLARLVLRRCACQVALVSEGAFAEGLQGYSSADVPPKCGSVKKKVVPTPSVEANQS